MTTTLEPPGARAPTRTRAGRRVPLSLSVSAWAVPVMVVGQFALLSGIPVAIALAGVLRRVRDRAVRWAAALLAVTYAVPLTVWLARADPAQSLSKDMHPAFAVLTVVASAALVVTLHRARTRRPTAR
ncbi:hypothetical protein [Streptomyces chrestomyceticus]|uniref:hypothetical protein n=1 Tax=Streptomyces chrestomyceticus TaxID=68185 RepID=UPI00067A973F